MSEELNEFGQKKAYAYDQITGEFIGIIWADPDQINPDNYLLPAYATFTPLDDKKDGHVVIYKDNKKAFSIDQRGRDYWDKDGNKHTITKLGQSIPTDALLTAPKKETNIEELAAEARTQRNTLLTRISHEIERRLDAGENVQPWRTYRQFLRAIPEQTGFPKTINWGKQPADFSGQ